MQLVIDTNVIVAALRSPIGASAAVVRMIGSGRFETNMSAALALEYEEVLKRQSEQIALSLPEIDEFVSYLCVHSNRCEPRARVWPLASDPDDELVAQLALSTGADYLVTHNVRHFAELPRLGISLVTPGDLLARIRGAS